MLVPQHVRGRLGLALVALFPESPLADDAATCIECDDEVKQRLRKLGEDLEPKLVTSQGGRLENHARGYVAQAVGITESIADVDADDALHIDEALVTGSRRSIRVLAQPRLDVGEVRCAALAVVTVAGTGLLGQRPGA